MLGSSRVYQVAQDMVACGPFTIPRHWPKIASLDIGIDHPTVCAWLTMDRDSDAVYGYHTPPRKMQPWPHTPAP
jgi:hypothetical protein